MNNVQPIEQLKVTNMALFTQPPTITNKLLEDLKAGREQPVSGQWMFSKKYGKKVKYVGTFHLANDGVVRPTVVFSYPKKGEDALAWNKRFKQEKDTASLQAVEYLRRYPKTNQRQQFVRPKAPEPKVESNVVEATFGTDIIEVKELVLEQNMRRFPNKQTFFSRALRWFQGK